MTEQEIDRLAQEYSDINYIKHINRYQPSFDGAKAEVSYESFKAGYQAAMKENEKLKKEVELLEENMRVIAGSQRGNNYFEVTTAQYCLDDLYKTRGNK